MMELLCVQTTRSSIWLRCKLATWYCVAPSRLGSDRDPVHTPVTPRRLCTVLRATVCRPMEQECSLMLNSPVLITCMAAAASGADATSATTGDQRVTMHAWSPAELIDPRVCQKGNK